MEVSQGQGSTQRVPRTFGDPEGLGKALSTTTCDPSWASQGVPFQDASPWALGAQEGGGMTSDQPKERRAGDGSNRKTASPDPVTK